MTMVKRVLKLLLPTAFVDLLRAWKNEMLDVYATRSYAQEGEDSILARLFEGRRTGFYVDIGAHHPKRFSNTNLFYQRGWSGINVDPNPDAMRLFRRLRRRDINITVGVGDAEGELTYYKFNDPALNTCDVELARQRENATYHIVDTMRVSIMTLAKILETHLPENVGIDFLSVDVEGYDLNVLRSNDWSKFRPRCVLVEILSIDLTRLSQHPIHHFLEAQGYRAWAKTVNTVFFLDNAHPVFAEL